MRNPGAAQLKAAQATCREQYLSCMFLQGSDNDWYRSLKIDLANNMTKGTDNFPKTMVETMRMLNNYRVPARQMQQPA